MDKHKYYYNPETCRYERIKKTKKQAGDGSIKYHMESAFYGSKKSKPKWNYNGLVPHLILNYIWFKSDGDYQKILDETFKEKSRIEDSVLFREVKGDNYNDGLLVNSFHASRYDYLRIAKAIMDDYQNDTCVGRYLKEIHKRKISKGNVDEPGFNSTRSYGGQFHMDYPGLKNRVVFGLGGFGGQAILIDVENSRIVVLNSLHYNNDKFRYNVKKLLIDPIKKGKQIN